MKIILPLHNKEIPRINKSFIFKLDTSELNEEYASPFYCEIGKQLYVYDNNLINDEIIGLIQNKKYFKILEDENLNLDFKDYDIIVAGKQNFGCIYDHFNTCIPNDIQINYNISNCSEKIKFILNRACSKEEIEILKSLTYGSFHNVFITKKKIFNEYSEFLKEKLSYFKNDSLIIDILSNENLEHNKKLGAWLAERFLILFLAKSNLIEKYEELKCF